MNIANAETLLARIKDADEATDDLGHFAENGGYECWEFTASANPRLPATEEVFNYETSVGYTTLAGHRAFGGDLSGFVRRITDTIDSPGWPAIQTWLDIDPEWARALYWTRSKRDAERMLGTLIAKAKRSHA